MPASHSAWSRASATRSASPASTEAGIPLEFHDDARKLVLRETEKIKLAEQARDPLERRAPIELAGSAADLYRFRGDAP